jgi:hypothetical protein
VIPRALFIFLASISLLDGWQYVHTAPRATPPIDAAWEDRVDEHPEQELWCRAAIEAVLQWRDRDADADDLTIVVIDVTGSS